MNTRIDLLGTVHHVVSSVWQSLRHFLQFVWAMILPKTVIAARLLADESARERPAEINGPTKLVSIPILGGLHHRYERVPA